MKLGITTQQAAVRAVPVLTPFEASALRIWDSVRKARVRTPRPIVKGTK